MDDIWTWPGWNALGAIGGLAGLLSLVVTLLRRRPHARWALVRIEAQFADVTKVEPIYLVFRNIGDAIAHDVHSLDTLNHDGPAVEQPMDGRLTIAPGEEIAVRTHAQPIDGLSAGRRYNAGEDSLYAISGDVRIRWREPSSRRLRSTRFRPNRKLQGTVPLGGFTGERIVPDIQIY